MVVLVLAGVVYSIGIGIKRQPWSANNIGVERAVGCAEFLNLISACAQFEIIDSLLPPRQSTYVIFRWPSLKIHSDCIFGDGLTGDGQILISA